MAFYATNAFERELLQAIFNGTGITFPGTYYLSLHTGSPGENGTQSTSEATYPGYSRQPVSNDVLTWLVATDGSDHSKATLQTKIEFPVCGTALGFTSETYTYCGIGDSSSGTGYLRFYLPLSPSITILTGRTPRILENSYVECD
jgi:hypothetical protein